MSTKTVADDNDRSSWVQLAHQRDDCWDIMEHVIVVVEARSRFRTRPTLAMPTKIERDDAKPTGSKDGTETAAPRSIHRLSRGKHRMKQDGDGALVQAVCRDLSA